MYYFVIKEISLELEITIFGDMLKNTRKNMNLMQKKVADDLDLNTVYYSNIENGKNIPKNELVLKLAEYFQIDSELLEYVAIFSKVGILLKGVSVTEIDFWAGVSLLKGDRKLLEDGKTLIFDIKNKPLA